MRSGDLDGTEWTDGAEWWTDGAEWASSDALERELQELVEEAHDRVIWRRLDIAAITVALAFLALSVYVIGGWAS